MRRFFFQRDTDVNGTSGTGIVVHGIQFDDGTVVVHWLGDRPSTVVWKSVEDAVYIHGHGGGTRLVWVDEEAPSARDLRSLAWADEHWMQPELPGLEETA